MNNDFDSLLNELKANADTEAFIQKHCIDKSDRLFHIFFNRVVRDKCMEMNQVIKNSRISRNYVYNIINGKKRNPGRDKILALCIGAHMNIDEINQGLELCDHSRINLHDERDVRIAFFVSSSRFDVLEINLMLESKGLDPLDI